MKKGKALGNFLMRLRINLGLIKDRGVINDFILSLIPENSLSFQEILEQVKKMPDGESETFKFDPKVPEYEHLYLWGSILCLSLKKPLVTYYNIKPLKGIYEVKVVKSF